MRGYIEYAALLLALVSTSACSCLDGGDGSHLYVRTHYGKCGYSTKAGKIVIEQQFKDCRPFSEGLASVKKDDAWGFIDPNGSFKIAPKYQYADDFSEGLARVSVPLESAIRFKKFTGSVPSQALFIDKEGKEIIKAGRFCVESNVGDFNEGLVHGCIEEDSERVVFLDRDGKEAFPSNFYRASSFSEGLAAVEVERDYEYASGYIDKTGTFTIPPRFEEAGDFHEGLAQARDAETDKVGFINKSGAYVIAPKYLEADDFSDGLAAVRAGEKWEYINKDGETILPPKYERVGTFRNGLAIVSPDGEHSQLIDKKGQPIYETKSLGFPFFDGEVACFRVNRTRTTCISADGQELWSDIQHEDLGT